MLRAIERAHAGIGLVPDAQVQKLAIDRVPDGTDLVHVAPVHADEVNRAVARDVGTGAEAIGEERAERFVGHFAGCHGELPVPAPGIGVAIDAHVVGRVEEGGVDARTLADHSLQERDVAPVAAADAMISQDPDITRAGARSLRDRGDRLVVGIGRALQRDVDLAGGEPRDRQVELDIEHRKLAQLQLQ